MSISSSDISIIVQGPVVGQPTDSNNIGVTEACLASLRSLFPASEIILSTWKNSDIRNLKFDLLIENEDPGAFPFKDSPRALNNVNRQIVSTYAGLKKATKKYSLKCRTDITFNNTNFLDYFGKYQKRCEEYRILKERVLNSYCYAVKPHNTRRLFHPGDWVFFGLTEDLLNIWDIPLAPEPETSRWFETRPKPTPDVSPGELYRYVPEQYIWITFLRKYSHINYDHISDMSEDALKISEISFANNLVFLDTDQLDIESFKYKNLDQAYLYTHLDWLKLYKKYCYSNIRIPYIDKKRIKILVTSEGFLKELNRHPLRTFGRLFLD